MGYVKVNTDGSCLTNTSTASYGGLIICYKGAK